MTQSFSRRDFLRVVLASGAVLLVGSNGEIVGAEDAGEFQPIVETQQHSTAHRFIRDGSPIPTSSSKKQTDFVVIGAGLSGLTAALQISRAGYSCIVVENEQKVGGTAISGDFGLVQYPLGSSYWVTDDRMFEDLCTTASVAPQKLRDDSLLYGGINYSGLQLKETISNLPCSKQERDGFKKFMVDMDDYFIHDSKLPSYPLGEKISKKFAQFDAMTSRQFLERYKSPFLSSFVDLYSKSSMGGGIDQTNAYCLLNFYASEVAAPRFGVTGGTGALAMGLSKYLSELGQEIVLNNCAARITNSSGGVEVLCVANASGTVTTIKAKRAVVAVQKIMLPHIVSDLPAKQAVACRNIQHNPYVSVHIRSKKELFKTEQYDVWTLDEGIPFTDILCPRNMFVGAATREFFETGFVYSMFCPLEKSDRPMLLDPKELVRFTHKCVESFKRIVGLSGGNVENTDIDSAHVFGFGHGIVVPTVGSHSGVAQAARMPFRNVFFAGTDNDASPSIESAVSHGQSTADLAIASLKK